ncbi:MAG TPA: F0F1 ATP synthase subunit epsilon [Acidimicrobiia bacterium]|nr:F0F1 ATP synthase subunit epsilon [Acidimicrobiia bacterium]
MAKLFQVDVVSPEATVWSGQATIVIARTPEGELGIMADHEPLMGALATGPVDIESESGERTTIGVYGGFIQVLNNQVTLITDRAQVTEGHAAAKEAAAALEAAETEETGESEQSLGGGPG